MMSQSGGFLYYRGDKFQAVGLPYGNGLTRLYLFLPDKESSIRELLKSFTHDSCEQWMKGLLPTYGDVKIPRFKLEYGKILNGTLNNMGMGVAFDPEQADFSEILELGRLYISEVRHKASVEINENGTEAAAATSVTMEPVWYKPKQFTFIADRPFLLMIRNERTGSILFMGAVVEPK
jgi:serine protease inhibitor